MQERLAEYRRKLQSGGQMTELELEVMMKEEKVRIALAKMAQANVPKLVIRTFAENGTSKTIEIDANMVHQCPIVDRGWLVASPHALLSSSFSLFLFPLLIFRLSLVAAGRPYRVQQVSHQEQIHRGLELDHGRGLTRPFSGARF